MTEDVLAGNRAISRAFYEKIEGISQRVIFRKQASSSLNRYQGFMI